MIQAATNKRALLSHWAWNDLVFGQLLLREVYLSCFIFSPGSRPTSHGKVI
jgi:hypothetical protein